MNMTGAPVRRQPSPAEEPDHDRTVVYAFRSRADRLVEFGRHVYRGRAYVDFSSVEVLPGGERGQVRRLSVGTHLFSDFFAGVLALQQELARRGEL